MSDPRQRQQRLLRQAEGYLELGMYEHALASVKQLEGGDQLDGHAYYLKGEALRWLTRYRESLVELHRAAELVPEAVHVWLAMGWCYKRAGRLDLAIESLEEALAYEPGEALLHYNLACYWSLHGEKNRALEYLGTALDMDTDYLELINDEPDFDPLRNDPDFLALTRVIA
ncbi:MAG: tetratricopeptide repeat protein [Planctomycetales bacterium]|nr:tetratricopeptide repeat protein [Planctomycetales bacterium]NIM10062.1 tetratricopeptide repeat protein [Planctomycetales bacterium]NIN09503.1 tetratricopeptide repeat protein [Planctomycetales bacterium]NIN78614.1 tetratricopeptide repeat protein [Planctomycetales bacterium]NIO35808.1 tetratricopeptide repeat protein [Planctomycetales bacterium]